MAKKPTAKRYAKAVFLLAQEQDKLEDWQTQLTALGACLVGEEALTYLEAPSVAWKRKEVLLQSIVTLLSQQGSHIDPSIQNLVSLLAQRGSMRQIAAIADEYQTLLDHYYGRHRAEVVTATELTDSQKDGLGNLLTNYFGQQVVMSFRQDPSVLGGMIARVGDRLIDASTKRRLDQLAKTLATT